MLTAFLILVVVGVSAGLWPALKASRMEPIEALRYE
jgi:ABC-type antimicrobial peptide transport system permease subunit